MPDMEPIEIASRLEELAKQALNLRDLVLEPEPVFPAEKLPLLAKRICLVCEKPIPMTEAVIRGNDRACHRAVLRQIEDGTMTENQAVTAGLFAPIKKPGRKAIKADLIAQKAREAIDRVDSTASMVAETNDSDVEMGKAHERRKKTTPPNKQSRKNQNGASGKG